MANNITANCNYVNIPPVNGQDSQYNQEETKEYFDLPNEILVNIFKYIDSDFQSLANASLVCKRWRSIITGETNILKLILNKISIDDQDLFPIEAFDYCHAEKCIFYSKKKSLLNGKNSYLMHMDLGERIETTTRYPLCKQIRYFKNHNYLVVQKEDQTLTIIKNNGNTYEEHLEESSLNRFSHLGNNIEYQKEEKIMALLSLDKLAKYISSDNVTNEVVRQYDSINTDYDLVGHGFIKDLWVIATNKKSYSRLYLIHSGSLMVDFNHNITKFLAENGYLIILFCNGELRISNGTNFHERTIDFSEKSPDDLEKLNFHINTEGYFITICNGFLEIHSYSDVKYYFKSQSSISNTPIFVDSSYSAKRNLNVLALAYDKFFELWEITKEGVKRRAKVQTDRTPTSLKFNLGDDNLDSYLLIGSKEGDILMYSPCIKK